MTPSAQYLLLLREPGTGPGPTPDELKQIMARFQVWMEGLRAKGIVAGTNGLERTGKILREPGGTLITDGPYAETKEVIGGCILINAGSLDEAVGIARLPWLGPPARGGSSSGQTAGKLALLR